MPCPCSTRCSAAAVAALKPLASDALAIRRSVRCRSPESIASMRSGACRGSPRVWGSRPTRGLPGQRGQQASRVPDGSPAPAIHAGQRVHLPAVTGADLHVRTRAGRPAASTRATTGPRGSGWSRSRRYPPLSALRSTHSTASNLARGSGSMSSRSSANMSRIVLPDR